VNIQVQVLGGLSAWGSTTPVFSMIGGQQPGVHRDPRLSFDEIRVLTLNRASSPIFRVHNGHSKRKPAPEAALPRRKCSEIQASLFLEN
jgi:hypothetical protein